MFINGLVIEYFLFEYVDKIDLLLKWFEWLELLLIGMDINGNGCKKVFLLYYVGKSMCVNDIYNVENLDILVIYVVIE